MSGYYDDAYTPDIAYRAIVPLNPKNHPISDPLEFWRYMNQTKIWVDRFRMEHKLKELDRDYLFNIIAFMQDKRARLEFTFRTAIEIGQAPQDASPDIEALPLYKAVHRRYIRMVGVPKRQKESTNDPYAI